MSYPASFNSQEYRSNYPGLFDLSDDQLLEHFKSKGAVEGERTHALKTRGDFISLIPKEYASLEIGPFANPLLNGENAYYCDVLDQAELKTRARSLGAENGYDENRVPFINFKLNSSGLDCIDKQFESIVSSHCIEHQPDLILHLNQVERRLNLGGRYFILIPDKRFCFDRLIAPSTIAEIIAANEEKRLNHNLKSVIEHRSLTVHNNNERHWLMKESKCNFPKISAERIALAIAEFQRDPKAYIDVHAWYFTPGSFVENIELLNQLKLTNLKIERLYPTLNGNNEFWVIMRYGDVDLQTADRSLLEALV